jgi:hypothetical protein
MKWRIAMKTFPLACLTLALVADPVLYGQKPARAPLTPWGLPAPDPNLPDTMNYWGRSTGGYVWSISMDGITLYYPERTVRHLRHDPLTGELLEMKEEIHPSIPPKKFALGKELSEGGWEEIAKNSDRYRIIDVRVGDRVGINYERRNGVDICKSICIGRRPGEILLAPPGMKFSDKDAEVRFYERQKAWLNWEQFRLPFPRTCLPTYMRNDGKVCFGPYPAESVEIIPILHVAPAPHEVRLDRALISP